MSATECGAACLAMVLSYFGRATTVSECHEMCGAGRDGATAKSIADASGDPVFSQRVMTELIGRGDVVPGAVLYWVPGQLEPVPGNVRPTQLLDRALALKPEDEREHPRAPKASLGGGKLRVLDEG